MKLEKKIRVKGIEAERFLRQKEGAKNIGK